MSQPRRILLGVSGSVAAVKALDLVRRLRELPAQVRVAMTPGAKKMIAPVAFEAMSEHRVYHDVWDAEAWRMEHLEWAKWAELFVVAPASANVLADLACGRSDNAVTCTALAYQGPLLICPAMNPAMFSHPATRANVETLRARGATILGPAGGVTLCGDEGRGRMTDVPEIVAAARAILAGSEDSEPPIAPDDASEPERSWRIGANPSPFLGRRVVVTAGATREPIDPVRFITNASTGKMGFAIAEELAARGAQVELIAGASTIEPPASANVATHRATTAEAMLEAAKRLAPGAAACVFAAAVGDFAPIEAATRKLKKEDLGEEMTIRLRRAPDIAMEIGRLDLPRQLRVGFAAETDRVLENAADKLRRKNFHMVCANDVGAEGAGFAVDTNIATALFADGSTVEMPLQSKRQLARRLVDLMEKAYESLDAGAMPRRAATLELPAGEW
jgi:phosphopantothenoylcysteine decarboxylase/phosphopantothenate--cysteine ligase